MGALRMVFLGALAAACWVLACSPAGGTGEKLGQTRAALVGTEFAVGKPAHAIDDGKPDASASRVACETTGRCVAVYLQTGHKQREAERATHRDGAAVGSAVALTGYGPATARGAGTEVGIATYYGFQRFDAAQGALLDAAPIRFERFTQPYQPTAITYDGENYVLVWGAASQRS